MIEAAIARRGDGIYEILIRVGGVSITVQGGIRTLREAKRVRTQVKRAMEKWGMQRRIAIAEEIVDLVNRAFSERGR